jgi:hypothetical protein
MIEKMNFGELIGTSGVLLSNNGNRDCPTACERENMPCCPEGDPYVESQKWATCYLAYKNGTNE